MRQADEERVAGSQAALEKYGGSWQAWYDADDPENAQYLGYDKVKFTVVMPDGAAYTERQDIGDGNGGVLDFLSQYPSYQAILPALREAAAEYQPAQEADIDAPALSAQEYLHRLSDRPDKSEPRYTVTQTSDAFEDPLALWDHQTDEYYRNAYGEFPPLWRNRKPPPIWKS